jgi:hypothetical protein
MCRIAVGAWQLEERARLAIRLCGFGALPLGDNFFQLRAKLGALRVSQIDLSAQLIQLLGMFCAQLITAAAIIVSTFVEKFVAMLAQRLANCLGHVRPLA